MADRSAGAVESGQAMVEFAIILPVLVLVLFAFMEFGRFFNAALTVQNAAREGARLAVTGADDSDITARVLNVAGHLEGAASDRVEVEVTPEAGQRTPGRELEVTVKYKFGFVVPLIVQMFPGDMRVDDSFIWLTAGMSMRI